MIAAMPSSGTDTARSSLAWVMSVLIVGSVLFDPFGFAPFGPIKWVIVTTAAFAALWLATGSGLIVHRASAVGWLVFLAWGTAVSFAAQDSVHTWIGTPDRRLGLITIVGFAAAYFAGQKIRAINVPHLLKAVTLATGLIVLFATAELLGWTPDRFGTTTGRIGMPYGTPAYLGAALVLLCPITLGAATAFTDRAWILTARLAGGTGIVVLLATQTRAALIGISVAAIVSYPAWERWGRANRVALAVGAIVLVAAASATNLGPRLLDALDFENGAASSRLDEWTTGLDAVAQSPILGSGLEGYRVVFPMVVGDEYVQSYGRTYATDRAHSGLIDVAIWTGIVGAALYVAMAVFIFRRVLLARRHADPWLVAVAAGVAGYLAQQQFLFPIAEVDGIYWAACGLLVSQTGSRALQIRPAVKYVALALAAGVATFGVTDVAADHRAQSAIDLDDPSEQLRTYDEASRLRPDSIRYRFLAANAAASVDLDTAVARIDNALQISPKDPILALRRAQLLLDHGDQYGDYGPALDALRDLSVADPRHPTVLLALGTAEILSGNEAEAEAAWLGAELLAPGAPEPPRNLATLYRSQGRIDEAETAERRAQANETE